MRAVVLNCTLKPSPEPSNTDALARVVVDALVGHGVEVSTVRLADHRPGAGVEEVQDQVAADDPLATEARKCFHQNACYRLTSLASTRNV